MVVSLSGADVTFFIVSGWFDSGSLHLLWTVIHCGNVGRVSIRVGGPGVCGVKQTVSDPT